MDVPGKMQLSSMQMLTLISVFVVVSRFSILERCLDFLDESLFRVGTALKRSADGILRDHVPKKTDQNIVDNNHRVTTLDMISTELKVTSSLGS